MKSEGEMTWRDVEIGGICTEPASAMLYKTGAWRSQKPTYNFKRCIKCGICQLYCPEGCIWRNEQGFFAADYDYCKGCGICSKECPTRVITMVEETE